MPRRSESYFEERRRHIITAARVRFARDGFHATSMDDVIAEAGLSAGAVYRYFKGKDELVLAVVDDVLAAVGGLASTALRHAAAEPPGQFLGRLLRAPEEPQPELRAETQRIALFSWAEAQRDPAVRELLATRYRRLDVLAEDLVRRWQDAGYVAADADVPSLSRVLLALTPGFYVLRLILGDPPDRDVGHGVADLLAATARPGENERSFLTS
jgi:TetR/AcrR family transcriptional regulator, transcriptional repressor of aconitase